VDVAEVPPAVLVDRVALALECVVAVDREIDQLPVAWIAVGGGGREVRDRTGGAVPLRRHRRGGGGAAPGDGVARHRIVAEREREAMRLLLATLQFVR